MLFKRCSIKIVNMINRDNGVRKVGRVSRATHVLVQLSKYGIGCSLHDVVPTYESALIIKDCKTLIPNNQ
jgi:hypothetical protein